ncbi:hypothetical protein QTN94_14275 [Vibrio sp. M250220]|uniref:hypothetical protein n=1 Tax=Vibrio sp. M250220 TaxID=3020894 RepID=UPI002F3F186B
MHHIIFETELEILELKHDIAHYTNPININSMLWDMSEWFDNTPSEQVWWDNGVGGGKVAFMEKVSKDWIEKKEELEIQLSKLHEKLEHLQQGEK